MDIVQVNENELIDVLKLQYLAYQSEAQLYNDYSIPPLTQTLDELKKETTNSICLVAKKDNNIIGSVRAYMDNDVCKIGRLIVSPIEQGKGVGKMLMEEIESHFPGATLFEVFTGHKSQKNLAIYQKLGYKLTKELKLDEKVPLKFLQKHNKPLSQTGVNSVPPGQLNC